MKEGAASVADTVADTFHDAREATGDFLDDMDPLARVQETLEKVLPKQQQKEPSTKEKIVKKIKEPFQGKDEL